MWRDCCAPFCHRLEFLLTHPVWDVTWFVMSWLAALDISTHTSRVGCDDLIMYASKLWLNFYSHIPCGMWLTVGPCGCCGRPYFYSHIPCGMWHTPSIPELNKKIEISTHTSRVGCDHHRLQCFRYAQISTHTSRVGCDDLHNLGVFLLSNFYSHIPCGMWQQCRQYVPEWIEFLLTHPVWDVTVHKGF